MDRRRALDRRPAGSALEVGAAAVVADAPPPAPIRSLTEVGRCAGGPGRIRRRRVPDRARSARSSRHRRSSPEPATRRSWMGSQSAGTGSSPGHVRRRSIGRGRRHARPAPRRQSPGAHRVVRLGWNGGLGGRLVRVRPNDDGNASGVGHRSSPRWSRRSRISGHGIADVPDVASGVYCAVARPTSGAHAGTPFIVRAASGARTAAILFVSAAERRGRRTTRGAVPTVQIVDKADTRRGGQRSAGRPGQLRSAITASARGGTHGHAGSCLSIR